MQNLRTCHQSSPSLKQVCNLKRLKACLFQYRGFELLITKGLPTYAQTVSATVFDIEKDVTGFGILLAGDELNMSITTEENLV